MSFVLPGSKLPWREVAQGSCSVYVNLSILGTAGPIKGQPPLRDKNSTQFMNGHVTHLKMSGLLT